MFSSLKEKTFLDVKDMHTSLTPYKIAIYLFFTFLTGVFYMNVTAGLIFSFLLLCGACLIPLFKKESIQVHPVYSFVGDILIYFHIGMIGYVYGTHIFLFFFFIEIFLSFLHKQKKFMLFHFVCSIALYTGFVYIQTKQSDIQFLLSLIPFAIVCIGISFIFQYFYMKLLKSLQDSFLVNQTSESQLRGILVEIQDSISILQSFGFSLQEQIKHVSDRSEETKTLYEDITTGSEEQASNLIELQNTIQIMDQDIQGITSFVTETKKQSNQTVVSIQTGQKHVLVLLDHIENIEKIMSEFVSTLFLLQEENTRIDSILTTIHEISRRIDLLAINVNIEAADTGAEGQSFKVISDDVKRLAENSRESAEKISSILYKLRGRTEEIVKKANEGQQVLQEGIEATQTVKKSFDISYENTQNVFQKATNLEERTNFLKESSNHVAHDVQSISAISQQITTTILNIQHLVDEQYRRIHHLSNDFETVQKQMKELHAIVED